MLVCLDAAPGPTAESLRTLLELLLTFAAEFVIDACWNPQRRAAAKGFVGAACAENTVSTAGWLRG